MPVTELFSASRPTAPLPTGSQQTSTDGERRAASSVRADVKKQSPERISISSLTGSVSGEMQVMSRPGCSVE